MAGIRIGAWEFDAASGELSRGTERIRLEDRAARTLELLARRRGEILTHGEIVAEVWSGRQQSPNSVAVVISDLRRALGEDARKPQHIETVTKRGYRLTALEAGPDVPPAAGARGRPAWALPLAGLAAGAAVLALAWSALRPPPPEVRLDPVANETGDAAFLPLSRAVQGLILTDLQARGHAVVRAGESATARKARLVMKTQLIMWEGHPAVVMAAVDPATGLSAWSGLASGPEAALPAQVANALASFPRRKDGR